MLSQWVDIYILEDNLLSTVAKFNIWIKDNRSDLIFKEVRPYLIDLCTDFLTNDKSMEEYRIMPKGYSLTMDYNYIRYESDIRQYFCSVEIERI